MLITDNICYFSSSQVKLINVNKLHVLFFILIGKVLLISHSSSLIAQERIIFNPHYSNFLLNNGFYNPAAYSFQKAQIGVYYGSGLGAFSKIRDIFSEAVIRKSDHTAGLKFYSEQKTVLFGKNKIEALYSYRLKLSDDLDLSLGTEIGIANINFDGSQAVAGGSAWGMDFSIGGQIAYQDLKIGFVIQQIPQAMIQPLQFEFVLRRYYDLSISNSIALSRQLTLRSGILTSFNYFQFNWVWDNVITFQDKYGLLFNLQNEFRMGFGAFSQLPILGENTKAALSFENGRVTGPIRRSSLNLIFLFSL